ncbi:PQQ-dependent sugar dehydrogenase, partial [Candidatus Sumerlaeota bacterium]|nr:PQQ-dependent sugar dehydrogenase [Candidatus Sumerlaeota bacterium]
MTSAGKNHRLLFGLIVGMIIGGVGAFAILYKHTGKGMVRAIANRAGISKVKSGPTDSILGNPALYAFGADLNFAEREWDGVRSPQYPWWKVRPGFDVRLVARGFTYPVNIAFASHPAEGDDIPVFYVTELYGAVKFVTRGGKIGVFAEGLTNVKPSSNVRTDKAGLSGIMVLDDSEDLLVTGSYLDDASGLLRNRIMRLVSEPGGKRMKESKTLLKKFGGKILRMNDDGTSCPDNPFYDVDHPDSPQNYVFAYGIRNVFGFDFDPEGGMIFGGDNGSRYDRLLQIRAGGNFAWDGDHENGRADALYLWMPDRNIVPVGAVFPVRGTLGTNTKDRLFIGSFSAELGEIKNGNKSIIEFILDPRHRMLARAPQPLIQYIGKERESVLGLAEGPDGLYFTDFFGEVKDSATAPVSAYTGAAAVWKVIATSSTLELSRVADAEIGKLKPEERGKIRFAQNCAPCHQIAGRGGLEGPDLTNEMTVLRSRLRSAGYEAQVNELLASEKSFAIEQRPRL